jgi:hypothetical protein
MSVIVDSETLTLNEKGKKFINHYKVEKNKRGSHILVFYFLCINKLLKKLPGGGLYPLYSYHIPFPLFLTISGILKGINRFMKHIVEKLLANVLKSPNKKQREI